MRRNENCAGWEKRKGARPGSAPAVEIYALMLQAADVSLCFSKKN